MLLTLYNITESSGNPATSLPSYGTTFLLPGGAGVQTTQTQFANPQPYLGVPRLECIECEVLDSTTSGSATALAGGSQYAYPAPTGSLLALNYVASNTGGALWSIPLMAGASFLTGQFGIVIKPGSTQSIDELPAGSGVGAVVVTQGPVQALCTAPTPGGAIAVGTPLQTDGAGNLQPLQPSTAVTPTITTGGTAQTTTYTYAIASLNSNGVIGAITAGTQLTTGNATLSTTNYNIITFTPVSDAVGYYVIRTQSAGTPSTVGTIGFVPAGAALGGAGQAGGTGWSTNSSGQIVFWDTGINPVLNTSATNAVSTPAAGPTPAVSQVSGATAGSTSWYYKITNVAPNGVWGAQGTYGTFGTGAATLTPTNANKVTWTAVTGAAQYVVSRSTTSGGTYVFLGFASTAQATTGFIDTGITGSTYTQVTQPTVNPGNGVAVARAMGTLASGTTTPTLVWVFVGQD